MKRKLVYLYHEHKVYFSLVKHTTNLDATIMFYPLDANHMELFREYQNIASGKY